MSEQKEIDNMMSAAEEVFREKGKRPARIGMPRNNEPWTELSQDERILFEAAREVDEERNRQSGSGTREEATHDTPDERFARLDAAMDRAERTLEEVQDLKRREHMRTASIEQIDRELEGWF